MRISDWSSDVCSSDLQRFLQHDRPRAGAAATVRGRKGLVQIDVHRIDAEVAGAHAADDRVEVRAVAIDIAARGMDRVRNRLHLALEQPAGRSEEHTSELQSLMRISYAVFCLTKKKHKHIKREAT